MKFKANSCYEVPLVDHRVMEALPPEFYRGIESCEDNAQTTSNSLNVIKNEFELIVNRV